jgi:hypothetical protein
VILGGSGGRRSGSGSGGPRPAGTPEPATLNLTAAAGYLLTVQGYSDSPGDQVDPELNAAYFAALDVWQALTGLEGDAALAYARAVAATPTTAVLTPF